MSEVTDITKPGATTETETEGESNALTIYYNNLERFRGERYQQYRQAKKYVRRELVLAWLVGLLGTLLGSGAFVIQIWIVVATTSADDSTLPLKPPLVLVMVIGQLLALVGIIKLLKLEKNETYRQLVVLFRQREAAAQAKQREQEQARDQANQNERQESGQNRGDFSNKL